LFVWNDLLKAEEFLAQNESAMRDGL